MMEKENENNEESDEENDEEQSEPEKVGEKKQEFKKIGKDSEVKKADGNPWKIASIIFGVAVLVLLYLNFNGGITGNVISESDAGERLVTYLNARTGGGVSFISAEDVGDLYEVTVSYQGDEIPVYITKDGGYFVQGAVPIMGAIAEPTQAQEQPPQNIPKSNNPLVELFIMTHCPYGTQSEKGIIPVLELLGDKIEGEIRFVHYFMHEPEETETPRQVCIREEQSDKWLDYLKCFLEDGDGGRCLVKAKIDKTKLNSCIENNADGYYAEDSELSQGYGVRGSPSLIINGQQANSGRDSANYLATICSAFTEQPEECNEQLSSQSPSPGFGISTSGGSDTGQC